MSCDPERVTAFVDGALGPAERATIADHLAECPACRALEAAEREIGERLRGLPSPEAPPGLEARIRASLRPRRRLVRWALPLAAGLTLLVLWGKNAAPVVAWELVQDHEQCEIVRPLSVSDASVPPLPRQAAGLTLLAASECELKDGSIVLHLQYLGDDRRVSAFVLRRAPHLGDGYATRIDGKSVRMTRAAGSLIGLVGDHADDVAAVERALTSPPEPLAD